MWSLQFWLAWLASELLGSAQLGPLSAGAKGVSCHSAYMVSGDLNSSPHACVASALPIEPFPIPAVHMLLSVVSDLSLRLGVL